VLTIALPSELLSSRQTPLLRFPEEGGERRVTLPDGGWLVFDGRLDDREGLLCSLPERPPAGAGDAVLAARAWTTWGTEAFGRLFGSFAIALWDAARGTALLARDPLGARSLLYTLDSRGLSVAREASPWLTGELDERWLAAYFAVAEPEAGTTPFAGVHELPPGHWLRVTEAGSELRAFWHPTVPPRESRDWTAAIRETFQAAVSCRLRGLGAEEPPAILLSGGLDSVPIAAAARRALGPGRRILAVSWTFERHPAADERREIAETVRAFDLEPVAVPCDDALPLADLATWPLHPGTPEQNPYRRFHERAYRAAAAHGARIVLSGMCGDQLWSGGETWLADLLRRGQVVTALRELAWHLRYPQAGAPLRPALRSWLVASRGREPRRRWPWLTPRALALAPEPAERRYARYPRPHQAELLLGSANGHGFAVEDHFARSAGVEIRYPLRDRRLIELALALPASEVYHRGIERAGLRRAFANEIPDAIRNRRGKASFASLFSAGVYGTAGPVVERLLASRDAVWRRFVRAEWIDRALQSRDLGRAGLLLWLAVSLEVWLRHRRPDTERERVAS
jgi:asparagine synthase (glutamine-hydrolysing)